VGEREGELGADFGSIVPCGNSKSAEGRSMSRQLWRFISTYTDSETSSIPTLCSETMLRTASECAVATPKRIGMDCIKLLFLLNVDMQYSGIEEGRFTGLRELIT
jgi:hypothetical protein